jgi:hypothetical protein
MLHKKVSCCFVFRAADPGSFVKETGIMADMATEMFSMSSRSNGVKPF